MTSIEIIIFAFAGLMTAIGVAMILRTKVIKKLLDALVEETEDMFGFGVWTLILGLVVMGIAGRTVVWEGTLWIAPLLGWVTTIKGVLLILLPDVFKPIIKPFYKSSGMLMFAGLVALVIGIWLFYLL